MRLIWKSGLGGTEQRWTAIVLSSPSSASRTRCLHLPATRTHRGPSRFEQARQTICLALVLNVFMAADSPCRGPRFQYNTSGMMRVAQDGQLMNKFTMLRHQMSNATPG